MMGFFSGLRTRPVGQAKAEEEAAKWKAEAAKLEERVQQLETKLVSESGSTPSKKKERRSSTAKLATLQTQEDNETQTYIRSQVCGMPF